MSDQEKNIALNETEAQRRERVSAEERKRFIERSVEQTKREHGVE